MDRFWTRSWLAVCSLSLLVFSSAAALAKQDPFTDVDTSYAKESISFVYEKGIMQGVSASRFAPKEEISRQEMAMVMAKALGVQPVYPTEPTFSDIAPTQAAYGYIEALAELGIMTGTASSTFQGNQPITRQDTAVILARALAGPDRLNDTYPLAKLKQHIRDAEQVAAYAQGSVAYVLEEGLMAGDGQQFFPKETLTRQEAAVIAHRLYERGNLVGDYFWGVEPKHLELKVGDKKQIVPLSQEAPLAYTPTFGLDNPELGTISPDGLFTAKSPGKGLITVNLGGRYHQVVVTVHE